MSRLLAVVVFACTFSIATLTAQGNKQTSLIVLNTPATAAASSTSVWEPSLGESVTFTTVFPAKLDPNFVYVQVTCYQNGALVFATAGRYDRAFKLGGSTSPWLTNGGSASCHAELYYWAQRYNQLATTDFSAKG